MNQVKKCDFRIHDWIDGKYKVERVLGHTSTHSKFKVIDRQGNQYMLKLLNLWMVDASKQRPTSSRIESEIASCMIPSNYLTQIVGKGIVYGNPYLLTAFMPSTDLSKLSASRRPKLGNLLSQILFGLGDLHKQGKVHCNLNPENVLITDDGNVLLTNYCTFGIRNKASLGQGSLRQPNISLAYYAPENFGVEQSATVLPTVDIYAFGVMAFQLLTGRLPFGTMVSSPEYRTRSAEGDWNKAALGRDLDKWEPLFNATLASNPSLRAKDVEEVLTLLPGADDISYVEAKNAIPVNKTATNGILLRVTQGEEFGKIYRLGEISSNGTRRIITVGREDASTFNVLPIKESASTYISRRHCTIELDDKSGKFYVRDGQFDKDAKGCWVNSLNGTFINSNEIDVNGCEIKPGDIISVGDVKLRVEGY